MIIKKNLQQENIVKLLLRLESADSALKRKIKYEIDRRKLTEEEMQKARREYLYLCEYIKREANKSLPWYDKLSCVIAPFSASNTYGYEDLSERELERLNSTHNTRQKQEILKYSLIGLAMYALLFLFPLIFSFINWVIE